MIRNKRNKAIVLSCIFVLFFQACSSQTDNERAVDSTAVEETINTNITNGDEQVTPTPFESGNSNDFYEEPLTEDYTILYNYYTLLDEEYSKHPPAIISGKSSGSYFPRAGIGIDGKLYFSQGRPLYADDTIFTYDFNTGNIQTVYNTSSTFDFWSYCNGYIYFIDDNDSHTLTKIDSSGNFIQSCEIDYKYYDQDNFIPCNDGKVIFINRSGELCLISPDFDNITVLPYPQKTIEHGLQQDVKDYYLSGYYNNTLYVQVEHSMYALDLSSLTWRTVNANNCCDYGMNKCFGKYMLSDCCIYDMEADEEISYNQSAKYNIEYYGGSLNIVNGSRLLTHKKENTWCKVQFPKNNQSLATYDIVPLGNIGEVSWDQICKVDDTYYIVRDKYGSFLHTYEKGNAEETPLYTKY